VIYLEAARNQLSPLEQFGLTVLVDLSGLLPVHTPSSHVVVLSITEETSSGGMAMEFAVAPGSVGVSRAALAQLARVAGAVAEQESVAEDKHQRVPSQVNAVVAAGQTQSPSVNASARAFRESVLRAAGNHAIRTVAPWPHGHRWAAAFTHDLDVVRFWPLFSGLRMIELARKGQFGQVLRSGGGAIGSLLADPVGAGVREILAIEREHGISSTWFVIAGVPSLSSTMKGDITYAVDTPATRQILAAITGGGHEVGVHGSFATFLDAGVMGQERERLRRLTGASASGIRQHFLRMRPGATQRAMREAGFAYDSSFGFPDRNGFRLGVAGVLPWWDNRAGRPIGLEEAPLIWMDRALSKYRGIEVAAQWVDEGLDLAHRAQNEEGLWVGLWHPNLTGPLGYPGAPAQFRRMAATIASRGPWLASLGSIVEWRNARRTLVASQVSAEGIPTLGATTAGSWDVVLEDGRGNPRERLRWPAAA
jgi:peptidoglycan/xylan/chitin deacetylase (PgdA/CDA1 family)